MAQVVKKWGQRARQLKLEVYAIYLAYKDPRVPLRARIFAACVVGYAFSPIDLIPDVIPILGQLDDLIVVPLGVAIALKMIPAPVMLECREQARAKLHQDKPINWIGAVAIVGIWLLLAALTIALITKVIR